MDGEMERINGIWSPPKQPMQKGAWLWWFWLFFIHEKGTAKTGKCRQLMILWSIKNDKKIRCNPLDIRLPLRITEKDRVFEMNGAAAAWYFDGERMHEDFVLENSVLKLDPAKKTLVAPGKTPSSFCLERDEYVTKIESQGMKLEFRARKTDSHPAVGPTYGKSTLPFGMEIEGTRLEITGLGGSIISADGRKEKISGTAYFQKILLAAPPPQWYWGLYHFSDGSFFTYMLPYVGKATFAGNLWKGASLSSPLMPANQDIMLYHAPSGRLLEGKELAVKPRRAEAPECWVHEIKGSGKGFSIEATAEGYAHACWKFEKNVAFLPAKSKFFYNEYPAVIRKLVAKLEGGGEIVLENGWGNMENSWGFLL
ncbi:MAG: hypothetical protein WC588_03720 [Candidatus Micrarchaeia archaeon]